MAVFKNINFLQSNMSISTLRHNILSKYRFSFHHRVLFHPVSLRRSLRQNPFCREPRCAVKSGVPISHWLILISYRKVLKVILWRWHPR
jgi:hypothetical protein